MTAEPWIRFVANDGREALIDLANGEVAYRGDIPVAEGAKMFFDIVKDRKLAFVKKKQIDTLKFLSQSTPEQLPKGFDNSMWLSHLDIEQMEKEMTDIVEIRNNWRHRANDVEGFEALQADNVPDEIIEKVLTPAEYKAYKAYLTEQEILSIWEDNKCEDDAFEEFDSNRFDPDVIEKVLGKGVLKDYMNWIYLAIK